MSEAIAIGVGSELLKARGHRWPLGQVIQRSVGRGSWSSRVACTYLIVGPVVARIDVLAVFSHRNVGTGRREVLALTRHSASKLIGMAARAIDRGQQHARLAVGHHWESVRRLSRAWVRSICCQVSADEARPISRRGCLPQHKVLRMEDFSLLVAVSLATANGTGSYATALRLLQTRWEASQQTSMRIPIPLILPEPGVLGLTGRK